MIPRLFGIHVCSLVGVLAATYALHVEHQLDLHRLPPSVLSETTKLASADPFGAKKKSSYVAMCDFKTSYGSGSCSKVFESSYGHILSHWGIVPSGHPLDLSLAVTGIFLYGVLFLYPLLKHKVPSPEAGFLAVCSVSVLFSLYLLYVLKFELEDFCVVCVTFHACNFSMFYLAILEYAYRASTTTTKQKAV